MLFLELVMEWGSPRGLVANVLDDNIVVSEFEVQSYYYVHVQTNTLGKGINFLIPPTPKIVSQLVY